jgi:hypothetical protein
VCVFQRRVCPLTENSLLRLNCGITASQPDKPPQRMHSKVLTTWMMPRRDPRIKYEMETPMASWQLLAYSYAYPERHHSLMHGDPSLSKKRPVLLPVEADSANKLTAGAVLQMSPETHYLAHNGTFAGRSFSSM